MTFVLRIFFAGLIAFVPSKDGRELTVLLLDAREASQASDGTAIPRHQPILLARAGHCQGDCGTGDLAIARLFFRDGSDAAARRDLAEALGQGRGTAWRLDGSDLAVVAAGVTGAAGSEPAAGPSLKPDHTAAAAGAARHLPQKPAEQTDFDWIANLGQIVPSAGVVDPDVLAGQPKKGLIVARLRLRSGRVWSYRLALTPDRHRKQVQLFGFKPLRGKGADVGYSQALAAWVAADIGVAGDSVEIVESHFSGAGVRRVRLAPEKGLVEVAILNVPLPPPPQEAGHDAAAVHQVDPHFERYFDLARVPPARDQRAVPRAIAGLTVPPRAEEPPSALLAGLNLDLASVDRGKGFYERILCAMAQLAASD